MQSTVWFMTICRKNHFSVSDDQAQMLQKYVDCLLDWNKKINLISRRDEDRIWSRHILASIALLFRFEFSPQSSLVDIGTGGGLPGIPLGILSEEIHVTLVDSIQKKIRAVSEILSTLKVERFRAHCARVEEVNKVPPLHHSFDYVIARGVGSISDIVKWTAPLLRRSGPEEKGHELFPEKGQNHHDRQVIERGSIILLKGGDLEAEVEQARIKNKPGEITTYPLTVDGVDPLDLVDKKIAIVRP